MAYSSWVGMAFLLLCISCLAQEIPTRQVGAENARLRRTRVSVAEGLPAAQRVKQTAARSPGNARQPGQGVQQAKLRTAQNTGRQGEVERNAAVNVGRKSKVASREKVDSVMSEAEKARNYIGHRPQCAEDVDVYCSNVQRENNFQLLFCLQRQAERVSKKCHQVLWQFKWNLTQDARLDHTLQQWCKPEIPQSGCAGKEPGKGELLSCLLSKRKDFSNPQCQSVLMRIQMIVFSDFRLIRGFVEDCRKDIEKFKCAKVQFVDANILREQSDTPAGSQGLTIACLEEHIDDLAEVCQKRLSVKEEQAADDVRLDRALARACQQELEKFCSDVPVQQGKEYDCLYHHKFDEAVSKECRRQIRRRQKIESRDYKADYSFAKACKGDIEKHHCLDSNIKYGFGRMAKILLCLDEAAEDDELSTNCEAKIEDAKERIMGDFELSHALVDACHQDVNSQCREEADSAKEGAVIECLMGKVVDEEEDEDEDNQPQNRPATGKVSEKCANEIQRLIERVDPGSDYHIDHTLERSCKPFIMSECTPDTGEGDAAVLSCLMEKVDNTKMPDECRKHLMHLQYFIARDFKLDHQLYSTCKEDANRICSASFMNPEEQPQEDGNSNELPPQMILACLYRAEIAEDENEDEESHRVSRSCHAEVLRVLRERAVSVRLNPAIHDACLTDLGSLCPPSDDDGSQEFKCLQQHYDRVTSTCRVALKRWTAAEAEDIRMDKPLIRACQAAIQKYCKEEANRGEGALIQCLVEHKNDADLPHACNEEIQDFQKIEMKDKSFDFNLRKACRTDGKKFCPEVKTRQEVLDCFKDHLLDKEIESQISQECLTQLKLAFKERGENIDLDSALHNACGQDAEQLCNSVSPGEAKVVECLREHDARREVSPGCHDLLQQREELQVKIPQVDYRLMTICKSSIHRFCSETHPRDILYCLEDHKLAMSGDVGCQRVITERQIEAGRNIDLDPRLVTACRKDIPKFCRDKKLQKDEVIRCLKGALDKRQSLTESCRIAVQSREQQSLMDIRLDAQFYDACKGEEVLKKCLDVPQGTGAIGCLKEFFGSKKGANSAKLIQNNECVMEVGRIMHEGVADIHNDPVLFTHCMLDLKHFCSDIPFGSGKKIVCLLEVYTTNKPSKLSDDCSRQVSMRVDMWDSAVKVAPPDSLPELASLIMQSEARSTILTSGTVVIIVLLVFGCFIGRKCRRRKKRGKSL